MQLSTFAKVEVKMRISTQMMYEQNMRGITDSQSRWLSYGEQMSTGKRVNRPSDDPIAASQAIVLSQAQSQNSQYALARTFATTKSRWKRTC
jgi:flagellar hook-associated protein 3 FlgL